MLADVPGLTEIRELGRTENVVGYSARRQDRELCLEVLLPESHQSEWFFRSSSVATRLAHHAFPAFLESGWVHGRPYRLREYVRGRTVQQLLSDGPLIEERLVALARTVAAGLAALHQLGYVHGALFLDELRVDRSGVFRFLGVGQCVPFGAPLRDGSHYSDPGWTPEDSPGARDLYALGRILLDLAMGYPVSEPAKALPHVPVRAGLAHLLRSLLAPAGERPSATGVLQALLELDKWEAAARLGQALPSLAAAESREIHPYPLFGRESELTQLTALWKDLDAAGSPQAEALLVGPPGSGRSRLLEELRRGKSLTESRLKLREFDRLPGPEDRRLAIVLNPLRSDAALQLAGAFLNARLPESVARLINARSWWPGELLQQMEAFCVQGTLRPHWGRWIFGDQDDGPRAPRDVPTPSALSLEIRSLDRLVDCFRQLQRASQDPVDLVQCLLAAIERVVPYARACAWLADDGDLRQVAGSPEPGTLELVHIALEQAHPRHDPGPPARLALPLTDEDKVLGGVLLVRGNAFLGVEIELAELLCTQARLDLRRARLFGEQNRLLELTRHRFLTAQIRPHFLFNALNTLAALILVEPEQAELLTLDMAEFLRTTFADRPDRVSLLEEVQLAQVYLRLEKARFTERLQFRLEVAPGAQSLLLPTLTLQPLIENAVRHGVTTRSQGGTVTLRVERVDGAFEVRIEDDGVGFDPDRVRPAGTGVGLSNVRERLHALYGPALGWSVRSAPGEGTTITFRVPDSV